MLKKITSSMSLLLAVSLAGCAADIGASEEDSVCGEEECVPPFDRIYRVSVEPPRLDKKRLDLCSSDPTCEPADLMPLLTVYFSEEPDPILGPDGPGDQADIAVIENSYLVVDLGPDSCAIDLTAAQLASGTASCRSVVLRLRALER